MVGRAASRALLAQVQVGEMRDDGLSGGGNGGGQGYASSALGGTANQPLRAQTAPPYTPEPEAEGLTLGDYGAVLWRRKWIILLVVVVATASAYYFANRQAKQYAASGSLIYEQQVDLTSSLGGTYTDIMGLDRQMAAIPEVMGSPDFQKRADALLKQENVDTSAGFAIDAGPRAADSSAGSNIIGVSANSTDAELAAAAANAYAVAFVDMNKEAQKTRIAKSIVIIEEQLTKYRGKAKLTGEYLMLKQRLQDLTLLQATATGNYRVLTPATVPSAPYAPNPMRSALLGFGIGLFAGIGLAFLLEQFDTRIRKPEEVALTLRQPILGRIPRISSKLLDQSSLVTMQQPSGHIAEAFRMVRTNLDFMAVDNDIGSIVVTSCVKSEGKSVATANLAISMALAGKKVVVVDGDLRRPRQHKLFGIDNEKGVSTVVTGRTSLMDAMVPIEVMPVQDDEKKGADSRGADAPDFSAWAHGADASLRLYVLPSGPIPPNPGEIVASKRFAAIIDALEAEADLVIVDSPAMLAVGDTSVIASCVDGLVFLVDMKNVKKPQLMTAAEQLRRLPVKMLGTIVRMYGGRGSRYYYYSPYYYYRYSYTEDGQKTKAKRRRSAAARAADQPISVAAVPVVAAAATALEPVSTAATPPVAPLAKAAPPSVPTAQPLPPADAAAPPAASPPESD